MRSPSSRSSRRGRASCAASDASDSRLRGRSRRRWSSGTMASVDVAVRDRRGPRSRLAHRFAGCGPRGVPGGESLVALRAADTRRSRSTGCRASARGSPICSRRARRGRNHAQGACSRTSRGCAKTSSDRAPPALSGLEALLAGFAGPGRAGASAGPRGRAAPATSATASRGSTFLARRGPGRAPRGRHGAPGKPFRRFARCGAERSSSHRRASCTTGPDEIRRLPPRPDRLRAITAKRASTTEPKSRSTSYALLRLDEESSPKVAWDTLVLDEAQLIKNPESQVAQAAFRLRRAGA